MIYEDFEMFCLIGYTRWPTYISADGKRNLGSITYKTSIENYVCSLGAQKGVVILEMNRLQSKTRFVAKGKAIHPSLGSDEQAVRNIFIYPDTEPEEALTDVYARGILLKGARKPVFVPLVALRLLGKKEAVALELVRERPKKPSASGLTLDRMLEFAEEVGIDIDTHESSGGHVVMDVRDPEVSESYQVVVSTSGVVQRTNVCVDFHNNTYLPEFLVLLREHRNLYVYSDRW